MHGELRVDRYGVKYFFRKVDYKKDRLHKYDAWTIHPDVLLDMEKSDCKYLLYKSDSIYYYIPIGDAKAIGIWEYLAGGAGVHIPLKFWKEIRNDDDFNKLEPELLSFKRESKQQQII